MARDRDIQELIERFASQPGVEDEQLDFKSKEITDTSEGRRKLVKVLTAMSNQNGGTVIVGVRKTDEGELLLQGFRSTSEVKLHLTHTAVEYSSPPISDYWDISFFEFSGQHLLRIDIGSATDRPVDFKDRGKFAPWIRVEDGMEKMSIDQIRSFYQEVYREADSIFSSKIRRQIDVSLGIDTKVDIPKLPAPDDWLFTTIGERDLIVFGEDGLQHDYGKPALYHLDTRIGKTTVEGIEAIFESAPVDLFPARLSYTFKLGERQAIAQGDRYFLDDLSNIESIIEMLREAHQYGPSVDSLPANDSHPVAVAYVSCAQGIFWFETQWRGGYFGRTRCGFVFTDLPFNPERYRSFFSQFDDAPASYEQRVGPQMLSLSGPRQTLDNAETRHITARRDAPDHMIVDNPYYSRVDELRQQLERPLPDYLLSPLDAVNRFPLTIVGGYTSGENENVVLDHLTIFSKGLLHNTLFVAGGCRVSRSNKE